MFLQLIKLEQKQFFRSSYWQKSVALNVLLGFVALYFIVSFLALGFSLYKILEESFPENNPLKIVNSYFFYWFIADLLMRFFLQKLPVMSVKPLLTLPIKKSKLVHYVLGKSIFSFFTFLPLFFIIPFGVSLLNNGYEASMVYTWIAILVLSTLIVNFLNFIIENMSAESDFAFLPILLISSGLTGLDYFNIISFSSFFSDAINMMSENALLLLIPVALLVILYFLNYKSIKQKIYLDQSLTVKTKHVNASNMDWTYKLGTIAPFLQLDLKMIMRNKRPRSSVFMLVLGLLYGLIFYPNPTYENLMPMLVFVGVFVTGIFMINYGQFIPAWDSGYYKLLMSQNLKYKEYIKAKYVLLSGSAIIMFVLSIPYVYFGWKILLLNFSAMVFNIGFNSYVLLYAGSFNRKAIDLDKRAAFNYQGTGAVQWLLGFPLLLSPILVFYLPYKFISFEAGVAALVLVGIIGIAFHGRLINIITKKYKESKHKMIHAFDQND